MQFLLDKTSEIPSVAAKRIRGVAKGYPYKVFATIGNKIREHGHILPIQSIRLDTTTLWHPIDRDNAIRTLMRRKVAFIPLLRRLSLVEGPIHLTEALMNSIPELRSDSPIDAIPILPQLQLERDTMTKLIRENPGMKRTPETMERIGRQILRKVSAATGLAARKPHFYKRCISPPCHDDPFSLPLRTSDSFYLISNGNGRIQAIKEAATELGIPFTRIFVDLTIIELNRNLCNLFLLVGNEFRLDGFFDDDRYIFDYALLPSPMSCKDDHVDGKDMLSLFDEMSLDATKRLNSVKKTDMNHDVKFDGE